MGVKYKLVHLVAVSFILVVSTASFAHEGHDNQDMVIQNLGDLGLVDFPVSCSGEAQKVMNTGVGREAYIASNKSLKTDATVREPGMYRLTKT